MWSSRKRLSDERAGRLAVLAALLLAVIVQRLMLHLAVILDRAKRRSGLLKPFARGPRGIAARRALAFQPPGFLLLGRSETRRVGKECFNTGCYRWTTDH